MRCSLVSRLAKVPELLRTWEARKKRPALMAAGLWGSCPRNLWSKLGICPEYRAEPSSALAAHWDAHPTSSQLIRPQAECLMM